MFYSFKTFLTKSLTVELVIGLVIAAAFQSILTSFVNDIILPPTVGLLIGTNTENWFVVLKHGINSTMVYNTVTEAHEDGAVTLNHGIFLVKCLNFVVMLISLFVLVKIIGSVVKRVKAQMNAGMDNVQQMKACSFCFKEIDVRASRCPYCTSHLKEEYDLDY